MVTLNHSNQVIQIQEHFEKINNRFRYCKDKRLDDIKSLALSIKENINLIDFFIQQNTSVVCKECQKVCCINKHGYYEFADIIYICAINEILPFYKNDVVDEEPCQFLSTKGCSLKRYIRPFRCNWYFCVPLINYMQGQRGKDYRNFEDHLQHIINYRKMILDLYKIIFKDD